MEINKLAVQLSLPTFSKW